MNNFERINNMNEDELAKELSLIAIWSRKELNKAKKINGGLVSFMRNWLSERIN